MSLTGPTNSLVNNVMAASTNGAPTPAVGMGATRLSWTDRHAYTVVAVINERTVHVRRDHAKRTVHVRRDHAKRTDKNGLSEMQTWEFTPNPDAPVEVVTLRKNGRWVAKGESAKRGTAFVIGERNEYHDPSF